jgi:hypothetical protein
MRRALLMVLTIAMGLSVSSCATVPTQPLAPGEVRLLKIGAPQGDIMANITQIFDIYFEAEEQPAFRRACFYLSGDGPFCTAVKRVHYGSPATLEVELRLKPPGNYAYGTYQLECFVEYLRDGKPTRTNVVGTHISVMLK